MNNISKSDSIIHWSARVLGIAFALFISIFAMDVFSANDDFRDTLPALYLHLIPALIVMLFVIISWKRELIGGIFFTLLGILYIILEWGKFDWPAYVLIAGPMLILGILYFVGWNETIHLKQHEKLSSLTQNMPHS